MAELNNSVHPASGGRRLKKLSTRVDLTPMVDLGFLLITFFVFTTSISQATAFTLHMPAGETPSANVGESSALTIIPGQNNQVFFYHGSLETALQQGAYGLTGYTAVNGIGSVITHKKEVMEKRKKGSAKDLMMIIYPTANASYKNVIDILDERTIHDVQHYAMVDHLQDVLQLLKTKGLVQKDF